MIGPHSITLSIDEAKALINALETLGKKDDSGLDFYSILRNLKVYDIYDGCRDAVRVVDNLATVGYVDSGDGVDY